MNNRFSRGYAVIPRGAVHKSIENWARIGINKKYEIRTQSETEAVNVGISSECISIIGRAFDTENPSDSIIDIAYKALNFLKSGDSQGLLYYISYLGGRFVCVASDKAEITVIPDCHATYAIYSAPSDAGILFASHWTLAAELAGKGRLEIAKSFMTSDDYVSPGGKYYPGIWTPYEGVTCVFPNCTAKLDTDGNQMQHKRFYPFAPLEEMTKAAALREFSRVLKSSVQLSSDNSSVISLTAGGDSLTTLAAYCGDYPNGFSGFTYLSPHKIDDAQIRDVLGANAAAFQCGIPHRVLEVEPPEYSSDFHAMYAGSFAYGARYHALAKTYYDNIPHGRTIIISTVAETGTVFYQQRNTVNPTPEALSGKFTISEAKADPRLIDCMDQYIDYTEFHPENIYNFDWHDLFYWEHRNAKWASLWYAEVDITGFAIVPYNCRRLIEVMLSIPIKDRMDKYLQNSFRENT